MNNNVKNSFLFRHAEGSILEDGTRAYEEDFHINQQRPLLADRDIFYVFAYGECFWRSAYQQNNFTSREFWSFEFVTDGDAVFICENERYNIQPGDVYILKTGKKISVRPGPSGFLRKRCVLIESHLLNYICQNGRLNGVDFIRIENPQRLGKIYDNIKQLIVSPCDDFQGEELTQLPHAKKS